MKTNILSKIGIIGIKIKFLLFSLFESNVRL